MDGWGEEKEGMLREGKKEGWVEEKGMVMFGNKDGGKEGR